jgi:hypothetical protein
MLQESRKAIPYQLLTTEQINLYQLKKWMEIYSLVAALAGNKNHS